MEYAIMIEGQMGLTWPRWQRIARAVEDLGFVGLYRSDHFTNANPPDQDSLELWVSLTWLASHTSRIEFGPLVTPTSFRHPAFTARMASAVDDLSGGRLQLGLGAGWQVREHRNYSHKLLGERKRMDRFEELLRIMTHLLQQPDPLTFKGQYFNFHDAVLLPRPARPGGPRIVIGGNGKRRTLRLAAEFASEWNGVYLTPDAFRERCALLDEQLRARNRRPADVRRTLMTGIVFGRDQSALNRKLEGKNRDDLPGMIVGTPSDLAAQMDRLEEAGVQRLMLQWLDLDDLDGLEALAKAILP